MSNSSNTSAFNKFVVIENKRNEIVEYGYVSEKEKGHYIIAILDSRLERGFPCYVRYPKRLIRKSKLFITIDSCIRYVQEKVIPDCVGTDVIPYLSDNSAIKELIKYEEVPDVVH